MKDFNNGIYIPVLSEVITIEINKAPEFVKLKYNVPARRINEIVQGKRSITPNTALRLSWFLGLSERFWVNLQARYDFEIEKDRLKDRLDVEVHVYTSTI
ncbi:MAG: addiction module antidote protein, HigA family [Candidatus Scalindua sp. AMX11]|nr:MAG: addiction module antidote protein, HigA family [Candidatus Scalindua sp.]NOG85912.1 HigA family addiction module antidote protein [Planctomycetota bacterium]RZV97067.1 MAG: addiction module antidote protein, HigA family [Candidatus Scalindua sp. SCAELEC01]TDE66474.1 MAG: addiction module antidote protein, HigA family [Candidatus Scalindua sp. AMX11]